MDEIEKEPLDEPLVAPYNPRTEFARRERVADDTIPMHNLVHLRTFGRVGLDHIRDERLDEAEPVALLFIEPSGVHQ